MTTTQDDGRRMGEDRRWLDRRAEPRDGSPDRRQGERRSGRDRRSAPRA